MKQLEAESEDQQCNFLEKHKADLVKDKSMYEFVQSIFKKAQQERTNDTLVLQCLADRLEKDFRVRDNWSGGFGETLLFSAVHRKRVKSVKYLLDSEVSMDVRNEFGQSVVQSAVITNCSSCLTLFLERGADPNERFAKRCAELEIMRDMCQDGWSLAHFAVQKDGVECLHILNQHNANLSATDDMGLSLVHVAIIYQSLDMLLELGKLNGSPAPSH